MPAKKTKRWSRRVTDTSDALDLDKCFPSITRVKSRSRSSVPPIGAGGAKPIHFARRCRC